MKNNSKFILKEYKNYKTSTRHCRYMCISAAVQFSFEKFKQKKKG